jgi:CheY-like chemotaxis protein
MVPISAVGRRALTERGVRQVTTILLVEDELEEREAIAHVLRARGHTVFEAADGRAGLDQYHLNRPAIILCDILMPERDGLEMISALRADGVKTPIIAMVEPDAPQAELLRDLAKGLGADTVLPKPVMVSDLLRVVEPLLAATCDARGSA